MREVGEIVLGHVVDKFCRDRIVDEVLPFFVAQGFDALRCMPHFLEAVAFAFGSKFSHQRSHRQEWRPACEHVVAHQQQATGGQSLPRNGHNLFSHLRRNPTPHAMHRDELLRWKIGWELRAVGCENANI